MGQTHETKKTRLLPQKKLLLFFFESFSVSFSDLDTAMEMHGQIQSSETQTALESSLNDDVIMNYFISTQYSYMIDKNLMGFMTADQLIDDMTLLLDDPSFVVTLDFSNLLSILLKVAKKYEDGDNLDEIYDLAQNILLNDLGFTLIESDLNYTFVVAGSIEIATFSNSVSSSLSQSLGIDFELEEDSVIIFFNFFYFIKLHQIRGTTRLSDLI